MLDKLKYVRGSTLNPILRRHVTFSCQLKLSWTYWVPLVSFLQEVHAHLLKVSAFFTKLLKVMARIRLTLRAVSTIKTVTTLQLHIRSYNEIINDVIGSMTMSYNYVLAHGIWHLLYRILHLLYGVCPLLYGICPLLYGICPLLYGIWRLLCFLRRLCLIFSDRSQIPKWP